MILLPRICLASSLPTRYCTLPIVRDLMENWISFSSGGPRGQSAPGGSRSANSRQK